MVARCRLVVARSQLVDKAIITHMGKHFCAPAKPANLSFAPSSLDRDYVLRFMQQRAVFNASSAAAASTAGDQTSRVAPHGDSRENHCLVSLLQAPPSPHCLLLSMAAACHFSVCPLCSLSCYQPRQGVPGGAAAEKERKCGEEGMRKWRLL